MLIVNRSQSESMPVELHWQARLLQQIRTVYQFAGTDPRAFNSFENPNNITFIKVNTPTLNDDCAVLMFLPHWFTVVDAVI